MRTFIGIGSNLAPERNLRLAVAELRRRFGNVTLSPVYRNPAVGFDGPDFLNLVAGFDTNRSPGELLAEFEKIHALTGRARGSERFATRELDIDLLLYGDTVQEDPPLPRPDVLEYAFALKPLCDIVPDLRHPQTGRELAVHWAELSAAGHELRRVELDLGETPPANG